MTAREAILSAVRGRARMVTRPVYRHERAVDPVTHFVAKAKGSYAQLHEAARLDEVPETVLALLVSAGAELRLHVSKDSQLRALPWQRVPGLALSAAPPSGEASALSMADFAIAETGTLAFVSGASKPSSWHFLPGREVVLVNRASILPALEDVFRALAATGLPSTLNLVTGPSRTGDIEQRIQLGAHGPRRLHVVLVDQAETATDGPPGS